MSTHPPNSAPFRFCRQGRHEGCAVDRRTIATCGTWRAGERSVVEALDLWTNMPASCHSTAPWWRKREKRSGRRASERQRKVRQGARSWLWSTKSKSSGTHFRNPLDHARRYKRNELRANVCLMTTATTSIVCQAGLVRARQCKAVDVPAPASYAPCATPARVSR
jgi:hypothetical protein